MLGLLVLLMTIKVEINWDGYDYYRPITDNFLFRPLGWKKPDLSPKYELVATIIGNDKKITKAYIRDIRYGRDYFVGVGDAIGDYSVQKIIRGMVEVDNGEEIKGDIFGFINTEVKNKTNTKRESGASTSSRISNKSIGTEKGSEEVGTVRQRTRRIRTAGGVNWQAQIERFQNSSPEQRQQMIQQFREMRGNRGGGRRRGGNR